jgi:hypothetical protein
MFRRYRLRKTLNAIGFLGIPQVRQKLILPILYYSRCHASKCLGGLLPRFGRTIVEQVRRCTATMADGLFRPSGGLRILDRLMPGERKLLAVEVRMHLKVKSGCWLLTFLLAQALLGYAADLKPDELVAHHLDSLGTAAARAANKSRVVQGTARFKILVGGGGQLEGKGAVVSAERKLNIMMKFPNDYKGEQFITDGDKSSIAATTAEHRRTIFGEFVMSQPVLLQEGLLGGTLSTAWALSNLDHNHPHLSGGGQKKADGRQLLDLHYQPKKSTEMEIHMYFEPETYRHVLTVYSISLASGFGSAVPSMTDQVGLTTPGGESGSDPTRSSKQQQIRYTLEERFSDFNTTDGITLPSHYNIHFTQEAQDGKTTVFEWDMSTNEVSENISLDPRNFQVK